MGYVYLLMENNDAANYKIGVTRGKIENRIKKLQTGNSDEISMCRYYETKNPFILEKKLHDRYLSKKVMNEWYHLSDEDVLGFVDECKAIDSILDAVKDNPFVSKKIKT